MKRMKRRKTIIIETHQVQRIRAQASAEQTVTAWCEQCGAHGSFVTAETAARLRRETTRVLYRKVEAGTLHFLETVEGSLLVCLNSVTETNVAEKNH